MQVERVDQQSGLALCAAADGSTGEVEVALLDDVREGDVLLVHADVGLVKL